MRVQIAKWGNSLGLRVPGGLARDIGLVVGSTVEIEARDHQIVITPTQARLTLADLLKDTTPESYRRVSVDWGPDAGREVVD